jgi:hypothetical protein
VIYCAILYQTSMVAKFLIYEAQLHAVAGGGAGLLYEVCKICRGLYAHSPVQGVYY